MNRGVELDSRVADLPASLVTRQVASGVPVRMAVLFLSVAGTTKEERR
jgi:aspartate carbamoyltransferase catalytic subunit